jgi:hypothetical protein
MLYIFSETYQVFLAKVTHECKKIMREEMHLKVHAQRFEFGHLLIPFKVVLFESEKELGFYNPVHYQIALNKCLVYEAKDEVIRQILRHELAHMICHLRFPQSSSHGQEFRKLCLSYGWGEEVFLAYASIEALNEKVEGALKSEQLLNKVKKLLSLATSENSHEAKLALSRANKLLFDHQLAYIEQTDDLAYMKKVIRQKRLDSKLKAIYEITKLFYVEPVLSYGKGEVSLEVIGEKAAVELADYVANFLVEALEREWTVVKKQNPKLLGKAAKNAFFTGLSLGYKEQIELSNSAQELVGKELIAKNLVSKVKLVYRNLGSRRTNENQHVLARDLGRASGKKFKIHPALQNSVKAIFQLTKNT